MNPSERILVYLIGFGLGSLMVFMILARRSDRSAADFPAIQEAHADLSGSQPLPPTVPESIQKGRIIDFGYLPDDERPQQKVWLLHFKESYPYVRVVEEIESGTLSYMAADQVLIHLADNVDVTALKPMLKQLGLRLRMFNRKEDLAVVGVLHRGIAAIPETIESLQPWKRLFIKVQPDRIEFQR